MCFVGMRFTTVAGRTFCGIFFLFPVNVRFPARQGRRRRPQLLSLLVSPHFDEPTFPYSFGLFQDSSFKPLFFSGVVPHSPPRLTHLGLSSRPLFSSLFLCRPLALPSFPKHPSNDWPCRFCLPSLPLGSIFMLTELFSPISVSSPDSCQYRFPPFFEIDLR